MKRKLYKCEVCGRKTPIRSNKKCPSCRYKQRVAEGTENTFSKPSKIRKVTKKRQGKIKEKSDKLRPFFEYHIEQIKKNPYCQNCGARLKGTRDEVAHIAPKRDSGNPEVMDNLDNAIYLCCMFSENNCHDKFDKLQFTQEVYGMPVFPLAIEKYKKLKPHLKNSNKITRNFDNYLENQD